MKPGGRNGNLLSIYKDGSLHYKHSRLRSAIRRIDFLHELCSAAASQHLAIIEVQRRYNKTNFGQV